MVYSNIAINIFSSEIFVYISISLGYKFPEADWLYVHIFKAFAVCDKHLNFLTNFPASGFPPSPFWMSYAGKCISLKYHVHHFTYLLKILPYSFLAGAQFLALTSEDSHNLPLPWISSLPWHHPPTWTFHYN